jgi:hypothetical protein
MAKLSLYEALNTALTRTKQYIDDNHYNQSEIDTLLALKAEKDHGYHVPTPEAAQNNKFLRNDNTWYTVTLDDLGAAAKSHGTHVTFSTIAPAANSGEGSVGTATTVSRSDHSHPVQTSVSGNAGSANKVNNSMKIQLNGGTTEGTNQFTFDGSAAKSFNITPASIGAAKESHGTHVNLATATPLVASGNGAVGTSSKQAREDHVHPVQTSVSGNAGSANKVNNSLTIKINGGTTEGTNMFTFDGSGAKTIDLKASALGAPASHNHDDRYYTETEMNTKLSTLESTAKSYTDTAITNLVNSAPDAMNTLKELADAIDAHQDVYEAYVEEMSTALAGKANSSHGTHVNEAYATVAPKAAGTAAVGTSTKVAREDHVHPVQTSVSGNAGSANKVNNALSIQLNGGTATAFDGSAAKSINITPASIGAAAAHNHDAYVNKNAFANVKVGTTTVAADAVQDTIELVAGSNVTITPDATNDKITIAAKDTTYSTATTSANGLMSSGDKSKLDGIASGAEVNQNAFANVKVGDTTVAADAKQDTLEFVAGSNITITPDATTDKITIAAKDTVYTHPSDGKNTGSFGPSANATPGYGETFNVPYLTVNAAGHVTAISTKTVKIPASDNTWRGIQDNLTSTSKSDSLSAAQGKLLQDNKVDKIEETALATLLDEIFGA